MPTFDGESYGLSIFFRIQGQIDASFFVGVCERTVERFLVNGGVKPDGRSNGSISFAPREELIFFCIPNMETTVPFGRAISVRQLPFTVLSGNVF